MLRLCEYFSCFLNVKTYINIICFISALKKQSYRMRFRIFDCNNYVKYGNGIHVLSLSLYLSRPPSLLQPCISIHYSLFRSRKPSIYLNISNKSACLIGKRDLRKRQRYNQVLTRSFMQSSQRRLQLKATPRDLHLALSVAT